MNKLDVFFDPEEVELEDVWVVALAFNKTAVGGGGGGTWGFIEGRVIFFSGVVSGIGFGWHSGLGLGNGVGLTASGLPVTGGKVEGIWTTLMVVSAAGAATEPRTTHFGAGVLPSGLRMEKMGVLTGRDGRDVRTAGRGSYVGLTGDALALTALA